MYISGIQIKNFKGIQLLKIQCNASFNMIIGQNNIGKSTIFEALLLWKKCYDKLIKQNSKGFFKPKTKKYLLIEELNFMRFIEDTDLFYDDSNKEIYILINIKDKEQSFELGFIIQRTTEPKNAYLRVKYVDYNEFSKFENFILESGRKITEAIFIYQSKPVSNIYENEPIMTKGQIATKINKGKSHEVLRNKIKNQDLTELNRSINAILENKYILKSPTRKNDEYLELKVDVNGKEMDIYLQGSGFLQIAEIFSSIGYFDSALNIILLDEPDSHIHTKLQKKLLNELKNNNKTQIFIISHNDNLVSNLSEGELFFLNEESKENGILESFNITDFSLIKQELGGTISTIEALNYCKTVAFVEGEDDIDYIKRLTVKYTENINRVPEHEVYFFYLRGKDYVNKKVDFNKRLISQLPGRKRYILIYDKDFSNTNNLEIQRRNIQSNLGSDSKVLSHDGYCIESTLFSDKDKLSNFLLKYIDGDYDSVKRFIDEYYIETIESCKDIGSEIASTLEVSFNGQKKESRPELKDISFTDFIREVIINDINIKYIMNKNMIKRFVLAVEERFSRFITGDEDSSADFYASTLFNKYIDSISSREDIFDCHIKLIEEIYDIGGM